MGTRHNEQNPVEAAYKKLRAIESTLPKGANGTVKRIMREIKEVHEPLRQAAIWHNREEETLDSLRAELIDTAADASRTIKTLIDKRITANDRGDKWRTVAIAMFAAAVVACTWAGMS